MVQKREENKQLRMGVPVYCQDGHSGKISKVITEPESQAPTYIVVKLGKLKTRGAGRFSRIRDYHPHGQLRKTDPGGAAPAARCCDPGPKPGLYGDPTTKRA